MLFAEAAILLHLEPVGTVLLVLLGVVVALFALRAGKGDLHSHFSAPPSNSLPLAAGGASKNAHKKIDLQKRYNHHSTAHSPASRDFFACGAVSRAFSAARQNLPRRLLKSTIVWYYKGYDCSIQVIPCGPPAKPAGRPRSGPSRKPFSGRPESRAFCARGFSGRLPQGFIPRRPEERCGVF